MLKKILISNIGNRNLIWNKNEFPEKKSFREETQFILENYEEYKEILQINILDVLLDEEKSSLSKVILFTSDQFEKSPEQANQDTVYAGQILKKIIEENYQIEVELIPLKSVAIAQDSLLSEIRGHLKNILESNTSSDFIVSTTGGTPQQKNALKIIVEYLMDSTKYSFYQLNENWNTKKTEVEKLDNLEHRKILDTEQAIMFCKRGNYLAGAELISNLNESIKKELIFKVLTFCDYRKRLIDDFAEQIINPIPNQELDDKGFDLLVDYKSQKSLGKYGKWSDIFTSQQFFRICETLSVAEFFWSQKDYSNGVLYYSIFIEKVLLSAITKVTGLDLIGDYNNNLDNILQEIRDAGTPLGGLGTKRFTLPVMIKYANHIFRDPEFLDLLSTFEECNTKFDKGIGKGRGLDKLRNDLAHNGKGVNLKQVNAQVKHFDVIQKKWHKAIGLPSENIFEQTNKAITKHLLEL
ncbi:hypothetical protein [Flammeovirga sp. SJP92]|uniref:hypothetical protein n=1 Tax=Flammeovirga sp. SJP92 TaxID=1775430 RepID=UPI000787B24C|nr:hypothetical protein [Flammeovirga sp. SJP92]KXX69438.1 hypothetical protein AVL50_19370 [Flammeovirga sp. SJP92]